MEKKEEMDDDETIIISHTRNVVFFEQNASDYVDDMMAIVFCSISLHINFTLFSREA